VRERDRHIRHDLPAVMDRVEILALQRFRQSRSQTGLLRE
jgi:hypothetical protein